MEVVVSTGPTYKYYITPLKAAANQYSGYQLMQKIHELAFTEIDIKRYRASSNTGIKCLDFTSLLLSDFTITANILNMRCGPLSNQYILTNFKKVDTCSILEYKTVAGVTTVNTILVFGFNEAERSIEIIALCSEGGGGTTFNYFLNLVKAALIEIDPNGRDFEPKIVLDSLQGALRFYNLFGFTSTGPAVAWTSPLKRLLSVKPLARISSEQGSTTTNIKLEDINNEAEALNIQRVISEKAPAESPAQKRKKRNDDISDERSSKYQTLGYGHYGDNPGADTAGGNMNKIKNKTINVLFRPFRILTKGSVKKSNKKRSKRRTTNKRKTRKNN